MLNSIDLVLIALCAMVAIFFILRARDRDKMIKVYEQFIDKFGDTSKEPTTEKLFDRLYNSIPVEEAKKMVDATLDKFEILVQGLYMSTPATNVERRNDLMNIKKLIENIDGKPSEPVLETETPVIPPTTTTTVTVETNAQSVFVDDPNSVG